jgi:hypothetical protein
MLLVISYGRCRGLRAGFFKRGERCPKLVNRVFATTTAKETRAM